MILKHVLVHGNGYPCLYRSTTISSDRQIDSRHRGQSRERDQLILDHTRLEFLCVLRRKPAQIQRNGNLTTLTANTIQAADPPPQFEHVLFARIFEAHFRHSRAPVSLLAQI